jgi:hypothetical protein
MPVPRIAIFTFQFTGCDDSGKKALLGAPVTILKRCCGATLPIRTFQDPRSMNPKTGLRLAFFGFK